jgi:hypothetical protein
LWLDLRKIFYFNRRRDHAYLRAKAQDAQAFHDYDAAEAVVHLDYKVLRDAVHDADEQEVKPAAVALCKLFGGKPFAMKETSLTLSAAKAMFFDWTRKFGIKAKIRNARAYLPAASLIIHQKDTDVFRAGGVASFMNEDGIILSFVSLTLRHPVCVAKAEEADDGRRVV